MPLDAETRPIFLDTLRRFVAETLIPLERQVAETDEVPEAVWAQMRELGLFGLTVPEAHGGMGLCMEDEVRAVFELARASPAFRSVVGTNLGIGSQGLVMFGTPLQQARWLSGIASGAIVTAFALTEAEAGSDSAAVTTRARREGAGWVLNGAKRYITNADRAHLFTVMARTGEAPGARGISAFLVPAGLPGLQIGPPERKMGQQGAHICEVWFDDVLVPDDALLGAEGAGFRVAMATLEKGRLHIAALCVGAASRILEEAVAWARTRIQFGRPIIEHQLVAGMLAESQAELLAGRAMVLEAARARDAGAPIPLEASAAKLFCSEMVGRVADRAVQVFGGAGYVADTGIERWYRDVRIFRIYEGTSEIQKLVIARELARAPQPSFNS